MSTRRILVTAALPYINGHIHLGHIVEHVQTDVWVRFQRLRGHRVLMVCADDTHGTATMIQARKEGRSEEDLVAEMNAAHQRDFAGFDIVYDHYSSTHSPANRALCEEIWSALRKAGLVHQREVTQLYDPEAGTFLADRFVKGTCPNCGATDQNGDYCSVCGATYTPDELIDPVSALSGARPEVRAADHLFVSIKELQDFLTEWTQSGRHLQAEVANYLKGHFLGKPLKDWDVSRPAPYFGFEIPDAPGHYWYVWFDAPIGYIASTKEWCDENGEDLDDWWRNADVEIRHFIGKDIIYFHCLFWPAMLKTAGFQLPNRVQIHGFLTVDGEKMSKSKGTFILASTWLEHVDPEALRYFYATKLTAKVDDLDIGLDEFVAKINSDLVGKVVNLASRTARFVQDVGLSERYPVDEGLFARAAAEGDAIAAAYEDCDYNKAMRLVMALADRANEFVEQAEPWKLKKDPEKATELQDACTIALNLYRQLVVYLAPVLPRLAAKTEALLNTPIAHWDESRTPLVGVSVSPFKHLMKRIEKGQLEAVIQEGKVSTPDTSPAETEGAGDALAAEPLAPECTFDDFQKVDLRVARVTQAEPVEGAKKLLKLSLSLGGEETRTVLAGIKSAYEPADLEGRLVVCVANLAPRKMKFGVSEGMVVAAGPGGQDIFLLSPDDGAVPGQRVH